MLHCKVYLKAALSGFSKSAVCLLAQRKQMVGQVLLRKSFCIEIGNEDHGFFASVRKRTKVLEAKPGTEMMKLVKDQLAACQKLPRFRISPDTQGAQSSLYLSVFRPPKQSHNVSRSHSCSQSFPK